MGPLVTGGGNIGAASVTTNFIPYYLDKKYRREDTPVYEIVLDPINSGLWPYGRRRAKQERERNPSVSTGFSLYDVEN